MKRIVTNKDKYFNFHKIKYIKKDYIILETILLKI